MIFLNISCVRMLLEWVLKVLCILIFVECFMAWLMFRLMRLSVGRRINNSIRLMVIRVNICSVFFGLFCIGII